MTTSRVHDLLFLLTSGVLGFGCTLDDATADDTGATSSSTGADDTSGDSTTMEATATSPTSDASTSSDPTTSADSTADSTDGTTSTGAATGSTDTGSSTDTGGSTGASSSSTGEPALCPTFADHLAECLAPYYDYDYGYGLCNTTLFNASMESDECYAAAMDNLACLSTVDCKAITTGTACPEEGAAVGKLCPPL